MNVADLLGLGEDFGARFRLLGLLPGGVLALFVLALVWSGAPEHAPELDRIVGRAEDLSVWEGGLLLLAIAVAAVLLQPLQMGLVRMLEGYWGDSFPARALSAAGRWRHRRRRAALHDRARPTREDPPLEELSRLTVASWTLRHRYPRGGLELPTSLGNALRAAEDRAGRSHGLDIVLVWPLLYALLPERISATVDDQRDQLDLAARFCATFLVATVVAAALLYRHGAWLLVAAGTLALAWLAYRAAIAAAVAYGRGIEAALELHRFDLLEALHLPLPENPDDERQQNELLIDQLRANVPMDVAYTHPGEEAADTEVPAPAPMQGAWRDRLRTWLGG